MVLHIIRANKMYIVTGRENNARNVQIKTKKYLSLVISILVFNFKKKPLLSTTAVGELTRTV